MFDDGCFILGGYGAFAALPGQGGVWNDGVMRDSCRAYVCADTGGERGVLPACVWRCIYGLAGRYVPFMHIYLSDDWMD